jgi:hypothetical protein
VKLNRIDPLTEKVSGFPFYAPSYRIGMTDIIVFYADASNYQLPITNSQFPIPNYQLPIPQNL